VCHISAHAGGAGYAGAGTSSAGIGVGHRLSRRPSPGIIAAFTWHIAPARRLVHRIRACLMRSPICPQADSIELNALGQPRRRAFTRERLR